jgi:hypothetical protein
MALICHAIWHRVRSGDAYSLGPWCQIAWSEDARQFGNSHNQARVGPFRRFSVAPFRRWNEPPDHTSAAGWTMPVRTDAPLSTGPWRVRRLTRRGLLRPPGFGAAGGVVARPWSPGGDGDRMGAQFPFEQVEPGLLLRWRFRWPLVGLSSSTLYGSGPHCVKTGGCVEGATRSAEAWCSRGRGW